MKLKTGRHTSAIKAYRQSVRRAEHNKTIRGRIRTLARQVEEAVAQKDEALAKKLLHEAFSVWDRAAKTGVVHARSAARKKSRLAHRVSALRAAQS